MKAVRSLSFLLSLLFLVISSTCPQSHFLQALFVDTASIDQYTVDSLAQAAQHAQFSWHYTSLLENNISAPVSYDAFFILIDPLLLQITLRSLSTKTALHPLSARFIHLMDTIKNLKNKYICFLLPGTQSFNPQWIQLCLNLLEYTAGHLTLQQKEGVETYLRYSMQPDHLLRNGEPTSLLNAAGSIKPLQFRNVEQYNHILPRDWLASAWPLGFFFSPPLNSNTFIVSKSSLLMANSVQENFMFLSNNSSQRSSFALCLQKFFVDLHTLITPSFIPCLPTYSLPFTPSHLIMPPFWQSLTRSTSLMGGWADPESYVGKEIQSVTNLVKLGLDFLWIEWNPEWFLSSTARKKEECTTFLHHINAFTKALSEQDYQKRPAIFLGTDITSNFAVQTVQNPVHDIFGTVYPNLPSPLDIESFWKPEVMEVFDCFLQQWPSISNGIPLTGVFLDLEMYHCPSQGGQYTSHMDFSPYAWRVYCTYNKAALAVAPEQSVITKLTYLFNNNGLTEYFEHLQTAAKKIGILLKNHFRKNNPGLFIGVYNITLPHSWFYLGLLAGLSSKEEPVLMATFNNEFNEHQDWLESHEVYLVHLPAVMLGKLTKKEDFSLIAEQAHNHHGVWLNRISRLEESRDPKQWRWDYGPETTPLRTEDFIEFLGKR